MSLQLTTDPKLKHYLTNVVSQLKGILMGFWVGLLSERRNKYIFMDKMCLKTDDKSLPLGCILLHLLILCVSEWLFECTVQKLVLVITCLDTNEVLERWQFDIECDKSAKESRSAPRPSRNTNLSSLCCDQVACNQDSSWLHSWIICQSQTHLVWVSGLYKALGWPCLSLISF